MEPQQPTTTPPANPPVTPATPSMAPKKPTKKTAIILWVLGALIVIGAGILAYLIWGNTSNINPNEPVSTISVSQEGFLPSAIKVKKGQEVSWYNEDDNPRAIYADQDAAPGLDSTGPLLKGDTYIYKFEKEGTVNFYDPENPTKYKGTIIVE